MNTNASNGYIEISDSDLLPEKPVVSVHMLAYNHGPYLAEAIEGVIAQKTDFPIELIIGEDCSTDNTRDIALDYQRRYPGLIRVIYSERNVGMHENYRRVIQACRGKYIAFCEGDDYWIRSDKLVRQISLFESDVNIGAVHTNFNHLYEIGGAKLIKSPARSLSSTAIPEGYILNELFENFSVSTCTVIIRRSLLLKHLVGPLCRDDFFGADWPMIAFVAANAKISYINEPMSVYRSIENSAMNQGWSAALSRLRKIWVEQSEISRVLPVSKSAFFSWHCKYSLALAGYAFRARDALAFQEASQMQEKLGTNRGRRIRNYVMHMAIKSKLLYRLIICYLNAKERLYRFVSYKKYEY